VAIAQTGEEVVLTNRGTPVAKIIPVNQEEGVRFGFLKDAFVMPEDFDTLMQDEIISLFEDGDIA
jgi:antitoxin (DNA-binding transcriptional repressor) of toxin-antitoxin stability system